MHDAAPHGADRHRSSIGAPGTCRSDDAGISAFGIENGEVPSRMRGQATVKTWTMPIKARSALFSRSGTKHATA
jgi:hypothetical protein